MNEAYCKGAFMLGTACRKCGRCLENLEKIKAATGLVSRLESTDLISEKYRLRERVAALEKVVHMFYNYTTPEDCPTPHAEAVKLMPELYPDKESK